MPLMQDSMFIDPITNWKEKSFPGIPQKRD